MLDIVSYAGRYLLESVRHSVRSVCILAGCQHRRSVKPEREKQNELSTVAVARIQDLFNRVAQRNLDLELIVNRAEDNRMYPVPRRGGKFVGIICLEQHILEEAAKGELCDSCKFIVYHEFGHLISAKKSAHKQKTQELFYAARTALFTLACYPYLKSAPKLTAFLVASICNRMITDLAIWPFTSIREESLADSYACSQSEEIAVGAAAHFALSQVKGDALRRRSLKDRLCHTPDGDYLPALFSHPTNRTRMHRALTSTGKSEADQRRILIAIYKRILQDPSPHFWANKLDFQHIA